MVLHPNKKAGGTSTRYLKVLAATPDQTKSGATWARSAARMSEARREYGSCQEAEPMDSASRAQAELLPRAK